MFISPTNYRLSFFSFLVSVHVHVYFYVYNVWIKSYLGYIEKFGWQMCDWVSMWIKNKNWINLRIKNKEIEQTNKPKQQIRK